MRAPRFPAATLPGGVRSRACPAARQRTPGPAAAARPIELPPGNDEARRMTLPRASKADEALVIGCLSKFSESIVTVARNPIRPRCESAIPTPRCHQRSPRRQLPTRHGHRQRLEAPQAPGQALLFRSMGTGEARGQVSPDLGQPRPLAASARKSRCPDAHRSCPKPTGSTSPHRRPSYRPAGKTSIKLLDMFREGTRRESGEIEPNPRASRNGHSPARLGTRGSRRLCARSCAGSPCRPPRTPP